MSTGPVQLLVSVRSPAEAALAVRGGADLIDLKEPDHGALGAATALCRRRVVRRVYGMAPTRMVSATVGDPPYAGAAAQRAESVARSGVEYVKVGLDPAGDAEAVLSGLRTVAARRPVVAVLLADRLAEAALRAPEAWVDRAHQAGLCGIMLDTAGKQRGSLIELLPETTLTDFVRHAREAGLLCGLAGSLRTADLPRVAALRPDYAGVRGAVCDGGRTRALRLKRVRAARQALQGAQQPAGPIRIRPR